MNRRAFWARNAKVDADVLVIGGMILAWIVLQTWIFPRMGVST